MAIENSGLKAKDELCLEFRREFPGIPKIFNFNTNKAIKTIQQEAEADLSSDGRVLIRASGTEPLIRVMVEGKLKHKVNFWAEKIAETVQAASAA